eukprot:7208868-Heterocapsa_arctica.AAC.1
MARIIVYVCHAATCRRVAPHPALLLVAIANVRRLGRLAGPYCAPARWGFEMVAPPSLSCGAGGPLAP